MPATVNTNTQKLNWVNGWVTAMAAFSNAGSGTYAAGNVLLDGTGNYLVFPESTCRSGMVIGATLMRHTSIAADFDLFLFDSPPTNQTDNSAIALLDADLSKLVGVYEFKTANKKAGAASTMDVYRGVDVSNTVYAPFPYTGTLYGLLVIRTGALTPAATLNVIRLACDITAVAAT